MKCGLETNNTGPLVKARTGGKTAPEDFRCSAHSSSPSRTSRAAASTISAPTFVLTCSINLTACSCSCSATQCQLCVAHRLERPNDLETHLLGDQVKYGAHVGDDVLFVQSIERFWVLTKMAKGIFDRLPRPLVEVALAAPSRVRRRATRLPGFQRSCPRTIIISHEAKIPVSNIMKERPAARRTERKAAHRHRRCAAGVELQTCSFHSRQSIPAAVAYHRQSAWSR